MSDIAKIDWPDLYKKQISRQYQDKKVLVLGGDGFLGSNCAVALSEIGALVTVLSRREKSRVEAYADKVVHGDLADVDTARSVVQNQDVIFDFVGRTGAVESNSDSYENFKIECQPHLNLFKSCAELNKNAVLVFCSSRLVYGKPEYLPVNESHSLAPDSLYATHKIAMENYLRVFAKTEGLKSVVVRLSNPYGPHVEQKIQSYGLINMFIQKALNYEPITIFGSGSQQRDYIHTRDVVFAFLSAAVNEKCIGEIFNLGGETSISIREVAEIITRAAGSPAVECVDWPREYEIVETGDYLSDLSKLSAVLGLPAKLPLKDTLHRLVSYYRDNGFGDKNPANAKPNISKCL